MKLRLTKNVSRIPIVDWVLQVQVPAPLGALAARPQCALAEWKLLHHLLVVLDHHCGCRTNMYVNKRRLILAMWAQLPERLLTRVDSNCYCTTYDRAPIYGPYGHGRPVLVLGTVQRFPNCMDPS